MRTIGIDTHKASLAACLVDGLGQALEERTFGNHPAGHAELLAWAGAVAPEALVGIEGSATFGAAAGRYLEAGDGRSGRYPRSSPVASAGAPGGPARAMRVTPWPSPG